LDADRDTASVWPALALAHAKVRNLGPAQAVLEQAAARFPDDADVVYLLADIQERQGRTREAVETLRRLLARHPGHTRGTELLAGVGEEQKGEAGHWGQGERHFPGG